MSENSTMGGSNREDVFANINKLLAITNEENDRGLVLSMSAFAEELLGRLLSSYFRGGKIASDLVEGFNAPLGTFSARIKAAYAVGLISDVQYTDLEVARKIRNEFAHNWEGCSFKHQNIKDLVATMSPSRIADMEPSAPKQKFQQSVAHTLVEIQFLSNHLISENKIIPLIAAQTASIL